MLMLAVVLSVVIGLAVGLLGGGGSILTTPMLLYVLGFEPTEAIASSLLIVAVTSFIALIRHASIGQVRWRVGFIFGGAGMLGAFLGGRVGAQLPDAILLAGFAIMMAATATAMIRGRRSLPVGEPKPARVFKIIFDGAMVGLLTGMVGAGGGFMVVPALVLLGGLPMRAAVATSLLVVGMKSMAGFAGYALVFDAASGVTMNPRLDLDFAVIALALVGAAVGSAIGARLSSKIHPERLRVAFGWLVLVMAGIIAVEEFGHQLFDFASASMLNALEVIAALLAVAALIFFSIRRRIDDAPILEDEPVR